MSLFSKFKSLFGAKLSGFSFSSWIMGENSFNRTQMLKEYKRYVYTIVSAIATDVAKIEFLVKQPLTSGYRTIPNHPFLGLIRRPNEDYSQFSFLELHQTYMELCGESFWYVVRGSVSSKPRVLTLLRPDKMDVVVSDRDNPLALVSGYVFTRTDGKKIPFKKEEILHFKTPNPYNPYRGVGPIEAAVEYLKTEEYATGWTKNSIYNSGRPSGIINIKGVINQDEYDQVKKRFKQEYSGVSNAGKTMLIKGAEEVGYTKLGMELSEVALKELKEMSRDDIMIMFRVSKTILGITDDVNRANAREAKGVWLDNVIRPKMERIVDVLDSKLIDEWSDIYGDVQLSYKDPAPVYLDDRSAEWDKGHNRWLTTNAIIRERNEILGTDIEEVEGGDKIYQQISLVPMGEKIKNPPKDTNKPKETDEPKKEKTIKPVKKETLSRKEFGEKFRAHLFSSLPVWQDKYAEAMQQILSAQEKEILKRNTKAFEEWTFDATKSKDMYIDLFTKLGIELIREQSKIAFQAAGDDQTTININERILNYLSERINLFASEFDTETEKQLKETIQAGVTAGESVYKLRKRVQEVFKEASTVRAERVARTETIATSNEAALESYKQSPMVVAQEWSTESGACEFCQALEGKVIGLESTFGEIGSTIEGVDGGQYIVDYTAIGHPPLHPNCMCSILPVAQAEYTKQLLFELEKKYADLDKRTSEAKKLYTEIEEKKKEIEQSGEALEKREKKIKKAEKQLLKDLSKKREEIREEQFK
jgi:HK97 family phage portal protein